MPISKRSFSFHISEVESKVLPLLKGKVFHTTKKESIDEIIKSGAIWNSKKLRAVGIPYSYAGQSDNSYAFINSFVSLVDLRTADNEWIMFQNDNFPFLCLPSDSNTNCFLVLSEVHHGNLILEKQALIDFPKRDKVWLPRVECWIANEIPINHIEQIIEVEFDYTPEEQEYSEEQENQIRSAKQLIDKIWEERKLTIESSD